jgi:hypothetical protein
MFCTKCGSPLNEYGVCPVCGPETPPMYSPSDNGPAASVESRLKNAFSNTLFLVMTILFTASTAFSTVNSFSGNGITFDVINILFIIAMWMLYATSRSSDGLLSRGAMKLAYGTSVAVLVIGWVVFGFVVLCAIGCFIFSATGISAGLYSLISSALDSLSGSMLYASSILFIGIGIALVFTAVILIFVNIFYYGGLKKFTASLKASANAGVWDIQKANVVRIWSLVFGILSALGTLGGLFGGTSALTFLSNGCLTASYIVAFIWLGQYFVNVPGGNI